MEERYFHIVEMVAFVGGFVVFWFKFLRGQVLQHETVNHLMTWTMAHGKECDEQRKTNNAILIELQKTNTHLVTLTEGHEKRIDRIEDSLDHSRSAKAATL